MKICVSCIFLAENNESVIIFCVSRTIFPKIHIFVFNVKNFIPGTKNISHEPLVNPQCVFLPPLHIKLGLMKIFVKALDREGVAFLHLRNKFKHLSEAKVKEGVFIGPEIKAVFRDEEFENKLVFSINQTSVTFLCNQFV